MVLRVGLALWGLSWARWLLGPGLGLELGLGLGLGQGQVGQVG